MPAFVAVVCETVEHQQGAQVGVAEPQGAKVAAVLAYLFSRITRVIDDDFLGRNHDVDSLAESVHIEVALRVDEFQQIEGSEIAGGIVQEHILGAGIRRIDARGAFAGVPAVDRGIVLHPRIAADMAGFGDLSHQVACRIRVHNLP